MTPMQAFFKAMSESQNIPLVTDTLGETLTNMLNGGITPNNIEPLQDIAHLIVTRIMNLGINRDKFQASNLEIAKNFSSEIEVLSDFLSPVLDIAFYLYETKAKKVHPISSVRTELILITTILDGLQESPDKQRDAIYRWKETLVKIGVDRPEFVLKALDEGRTRAHSPLVRAFSKIEFAEFPVGRPSRFILHLLHDMFGIERNPISVADQIYERRWNLPQRQRACKPSPAQD